MEKIGHCWFARDVTAAILEIKNESISLLWELNSCQLPIDVVNTGCSYTAIHILDFSRASFFSNVFMCMVVPRLCLSVYSQVS